MFSQAGLFYSDIKLTGTGAKLMIGVPYQGSALGDEIPDAYKDTEDFNTIEYPTPGTGPLQ